jgi:hypothetical protein
MRKPFSSLFTRLSEESTRFDSSVTRHPDPHNVFGRDPVVIPKLFVDITQPWYRHHPTLLLVVVLVLLAAAFGGLVARYGLEGVLRGYARLVG